MKKIYSFKCQVCGDARRTGEGHPYAEAHHIRPLGSPHDGPDNKANIMVLCPNHHSDFDLGAIAIDPSDGRTVVHKYDESLDGKSAHFLATHQLGKEILEYHWTKIFRAEIPRQPN